MSIAKLIGGDNKSDDSPSQSNNETVINNDESNYISELLSSISSGLDPKMIQLLANGIKEFGNTENDQLHILLRALQPFLKETRKSNLDKAIQIAKLSRIARVFFHGMNGGDDHV